MTGTKTLTLGAEYDEPLRAALMGALRQLGAKEMDHGRAVAGSQEVVHGAFELDGAELIVEAESYVGLTITGPSDSVDAVLTAMEKKQA